MLFLVWTGEPHRSTKDLDLLALKSASIQHLEGVFQNVLKTFVDDDGLIFIPDAVAAEPIRENEIYQGIRLRMEARLGAARIPLQVDIGFGDVVTPKAGRIIFPTLLNLPAPSVMAYPKETAIAEKFEIMVKLGMANSRMKDYHDIWTLCREFEFQGEMLGKAIRATFQRRGTAIPIQLPNAFSPEFSTDPSKRQQWAAFTKRGKLRVTEPDLAVVVAVVRDFLWPVARAVVGEASFKGQWTHGGGWS